jgi:hypothetical protein
LYPDRQTWIAAVEAVVATLQRDRLLLADDAATYLARARAAP